jgi:hypothetical protein
METHIRITGALLMVLSVIHIGFPKRFNWKVELQSLSLINKQIMQVHTFFIAFVVFLMGMLCLVASTELVSTHLGKMISLGLFIFWLFRLFFQLFVYSPQLWRGKTFETSVHLIFTALWCYLSAVFLLSFLQ